MKFALIVLLIVFQGVTAAADVPESISRRIIENTVRISKFDGSGSGAIFRETNDVYQISTNAHVAGRRVGAKVGVEFQKVVPGVGVFVSPRFSGTVVATQLVDRKSIDRAVVEVSKRNLPNHVRFPVIPLLTDYESFRGASLVATAGCRGGDFQRFNFASVIQHDVLNGITRIQPTCRPGDSGSAIYTDDAKWQVGVLTWMSGGSYRQSSGSAQRVENYGVWIAQSLGLAARTETRVPVQHRDNSLPPDLKPIPLAPLQLAQVQYSETEWGSDPRNPFFNCPEWDQTPGGGRLQGNRGNGGDWGFGGPSVPDVDPTIPALPADPPSDPEPIPASPDRTDEIISEIGEQHAITRQLLSTPSVSKPDPPEPESVSGETPTQERFTWNVNKSVLLSLVSCIVGTLLAIASSRLFKRC